MLSFLYAIASVRNLILTMGIEIFAKAAHFLGVQEDFVRIAFMFVLNILLSNATLN